MASSELTQSSIQSSRRRGWVLEVDELLLGSYLLIGYVFLTSTFALPLDHRALNGMSEWLD